MERRLLFHLVIVFIVNGICASCACEREKGDFVVVSPMGRADLVVDSLEDHLVHTAAGLLADDVFLVSGSRPVIKTNSQSDYQIRIGTLGVNPAFDAECKSVGVDTEELGSLWEGYVLKVETNSHKKSTLWVVGSDARGTSYGLMELSRRIGVSPWYWWADVVPEKREEIVLPGDLHQKDAPKVKFRGIFLNDEDWGLQPWAAKTFEPETGDIGPKTYEKIFELLLRLKANAIWPAMHPCTRAFFTYPDNIKMARKYGIWVGSSHCEPMLRNNVDEWHRWKPSEGDRGPWNFDENPEQITEYWKQRVETAASYDAIYTVGMRGIHDGSMPGGRNIKEKVEILGRVMDTQRQLLSTITGREITTIPQIFCPYKEVLRLYKEGADIPEDVTIMWADDNHGYIRQLSNHEERMRPGGAGVYYHISYWGRPHDYLWLESIPVSLIWEEMNKAYQTNSKNVWIVNVGDIKPNEIGMSFFLEMAWDPDQFDPLTLEDYYSRFAASQFGREYADEIGEVLRQYFRLGFSRKPEHMGWNGVYPNTPVQDPELSLFFNGDEVQQRIEAYDRLEQKVESLYAQMPERLKDAFYQLVGFKVIGASNMNKKHLYAFKSRIYAAQGRLSANEYAKRAKEAFEKIKKATIFYNDSISKGKWKYMMTFNPRKLPVFDMPATGSSEPVASMAGGIIPEGYLNPVDSSVIGVSLPVFNSYTNRRYFVDVFNAGVEPLTWSAETEQPWIQLSKKSGRTTTEERVWVSVNWNKVNVKDTLRATIKFKVKNNIYPVMVKAVEPDWLERDEQVFIEDNGIIAMEAEHFSDQVSSEKGEWKLIQGLGRSSDAMGTFPVTALPFNLGNLNEAASLAYDFYLFTAGEITLRFYCLPNQPINDDYQLRFAVSLDGGDPVVVNAALEKEMNEHNREWKNNVLRAVTIRESKLSVQEKGKHRLKIMMIDPGVVIDKIEIRTEKSFGESYMGAKETLAGRNE